MIKIEFDLPEFEKELNLSVTLKKDGEVIATSSSSDGVKTDVSSGVAWKQSESNTGNSWKQNVQEQRVTQNPNSTKRTGGNMMDISF